MCGSTGTLSYSVVMDRQHVWECIGLDLDGDRRVGQHARKHLHRLELAHGSPALGWAHPRPMMSLIKALIVAGAAYGVAVVTMLIVMVNS